MKPLSVTQVNNLYVCASSCRVYRYEVFDPDLYNLFRLSSQLMKALGELSQEDFWKKLLWHLKRFRFELSSAPLPISWNALETSQFMQKHLKHCHVLYPDFVKTTNDIIDHINLLSKADKNPLLDPILGIIEKGGVERTAVLLKEPRLVDAVEQELFRTPELAELEVLNQFQVRTVDCYSRLVVLGPTRWFPEHLLSAPRAREIHLIRYSWFKDECQLRPAFVSSSPIPQKTVSSSNQIREQVIGLAPPVVLPDDLQADLDPSIDWKNIASRIGYSSGSDQDAADVEARLLLLAGNRGVFVETADNAKVLVIDFENESEDEQDSSAFQKIPSNQLRAGMFILLRTAGGGDYVVPVADHILGHRAVELRAQQEAWKSRLREFVKREGALVASIALLDLGSDRANEANTRNWMSTRNLRPQSYQDFLAIMKLVGLEQDAKQYWAVAREIAIAHRKAGFHIRKLLLNQVQQLDPKSLHHLGWVDFELPEADGGSLTAFRVEHISPSTITVPELRIGRPLKMES